jgi:DNA polymerase-3 subunit epsilon
MSVILGIDFETTGLDLANDRVTEVGLVLWDRTTKQPVSISGFFVKSDKEITPEITKLTGITKEMLDKFGRDEPTALSDIDSVIKQADYVIAHNGNDFDKPLLKNWYARSGNSLPDKLWLDSKTDLPEEAYGHSASLKYMACDHGFVYEAHRAVSDVLAMLRILGQYDVDAVIETAKQPTVHVQALVTFDTNKLAKDRGYHWKPETSNG